MWDIFSVFYIINVCCVYSLELPYRGDSNGCTQHTFARYKKKISLNYPHIVFGGNPFGHKNVFDSSMVNEPSGFELLKFYCSCLSFSLVLGLDMYLIVSVPDITKTRLYNFDPHFYIVKTGFTGVHIIFLISALNIDCGYSLEPPSRRF